MPLLQRWSQLAYPVVDALEGPSCYVAGKIYLDFKMLNALQGLNSEESQDVTESSRFTKRGGTKSVVVQHISVPNAYTEDKCIGGEKKVASFTVDLFADVEECCCNAFANSIVIVMAAFWDNF